MTLITFKQDSFKSQFDALPPGEYLAEISDTNFKLSKAGNPMIEVVYDIKDDNGVSRKLWDFITLTEQVMKWKIPATLDMLGLKDMTVEHGFTVDFDTDETGAYVFKQGFKFADTTDEDGRRPFIGFEFGNGDVYAMAGNTVKVTLDVIPDDRDKEKKVNKIKRGEIVGTCRKAGGADLESANTGERSDLM